MKDARLATVKFVLALAAEMVGVFRGIFATAGHEGRLDERRIHDSNLSGQLNHRTGRLDSGLQSYCHYDRD